MKILLIEDSEGYQLLMSKVLLNVFPQAQLETSEDGVEALRVLGQALLTNSLPNLIVLDLNLPRMNGREFMQNLRAEASYAGICVIVLTSSESPEDIAACRNLGVNGFFTKPAGYRALTETAGHMLSVYNAFLRQNQPPRI